MSLVWTAFKHVGGAVRDGAGLLMLHVASASAVLGRLKPADLRLDR